MSQRSIKERSFGWEPIKPAVVTFGVALLIVLINLWRFGGDPLALARIGTRFSEGDPNGSEGYDGQFVYFLARDPHPNRVAAFLDVPAYRYQRILMPLLGRTLALGKVDAVPWTLLAVGLASLTAGTWAVSALLLGWGTNPWYGLIYGLWAGFLLAVVVDLPEPLAYGLIVFGLLALQRSMKLLGWILIGVSVFAKEVSLVFLAALLVVYLQERHWKDFFGLVGIGLLPFMLFQGWLWWVFGEPGIGSGGWMATPFEVIPFMGLWRIGSESLTYLLAMGVVFGPTIVFPAVWGIWNSVRRWLAGNRSVFTAALAFNGLMVAMMPFSTFRETGGVLRYSCGLVLAVLLFSAFFRIKKVLNYAAFWLVLNVFLLK